MSSLRLLTIALGVATLTAVIAPIGKNEISCTQPLRTFCAGGCSPYDRQVVRYQPYGSLMQTGTCGGLRFIKVNGGFVTETRFYARTGEVVGAVTTTDYEISLMCGNRQSYGNVPVCRGH